MLEKAEGYGYRNAGFILDRGYFSEPNIRFMERNGYEFILMVKGYKELINRVILEHKGSFEDEWEYAIPYYDENGITVKDYLYKDLLKGSHEGDPEKEAKELGKRLGMLTN